MADNFDSPELTYTPDTIIGSLTAGKRSPRQGDGGDTATKTRSTFYNPTDVAAARANVQQYDWAAEARTTAVSQADEVLDLYGGLDGIWRFPTSQTIPRAYPVHVDGVPGSPISGTRIYEVDHQYPWKVDPVNDPWKVIDPVSGFKFPTNDFQSYYESGLDEHHEFDPDRADDSFLVNELYPEKGEKWGVDDGYGWTDEEGYKYVFVAYYNHWAVWFEANSEGHMGYSVHEMLQIFRDAYLLSGDVTYARAGTVLLDRIADLYPDMDISAYPQEDGYTNSDGSTEVGKILGSIWECTIMEDFLLAYDAFFPAQSDERLVAFLNEKAETYELGSKSSIGQIRENIEENIVQETLPAVKNGQIRGNFPMHQQTLTLSAVVQDDPGGYTTDALEHVFRAGGVVGRGDDDRAIEVTGGNVLAELVDVFDRDGHAEESPGYNGIHYKGVQEIADMINGYDLYGGPDLYDHVKVRESHAAPIRMTLLNRYYPHIGDSVGPGAPGLEHLRHFDSGDLMTAYQRYGDPRYAQMADLIHRQSEDPTDGPDGLPSLIFTTNPDQLIEDVAAVVEAEGPLDLPSISEPGFGLVTLRDGSPPEGNAGIQQSTQRAIWLYHGRDGSYSSHNHQDVLNLGVFAHELNLTPDLGYFVSPNYAPRIGDWYKNTISHNTVTVDRKTQADNRNRGGVGFPRQFGDATRVTHADVDAPCAYSQAEVYRRTTAMIAVDEAESYAVDFFRVQGGEDHHFSFHAGEGDLGTAGLELSPQSAGTYAGPDVPLPGHLDETEYTEAVGDGFNYLYNVRRDDDPSAGFSVEWDLEDTYGVRTEAGLPPDEVSLRLTMLTEVDDVAVCDFDVQTEAVPDTFTYLLAHTTGADLSSTFTSVIEPYAGSRYVETIERAPVAVEDGTDVQAVKVELRTGRTDYVVSAAAPTATYTVDERFRAAGSFAVYSESEGRPEYAYLQDGHLFEHLSSAEPRISHSQGRYEGTIRSFTRELSRDSEIEIEIDAGPHGTHPLSDLPGAWIYADTGGPHNGAYEIQGVTTNSDSRATLAVEKTTVREFTDAERPEDGFEYLVSEGDRFSIPITSEWRRT